MLEVSVDKSKNTITITLPYNEKGTKSASGKSNVHATTSGNQAVEVNGKTLNIGVNAYTKAS